MEYQNVLKDFSKRTKQKLILIEKAKKNGDEIYEATLNLPKIIIVKE